MKRKQRGTLIVEYVIVFPFMALLIFLTVYFGIAFHDYNAVNQVARETARYGVVGTNKISVVKTKALTRCNDLLSRLYTVTENDITITTGKDTTLNSEKYLDVTIVATKNNSQSMSLIDEFLPEQLTGTTRMRVEVDAPAETTTDKDKDKDKDDADAPKTKN